MAEIINNTGENIEKAFEEKALKIWRVFLEDNYPPSRNRPDDPNDFWNRIFNNTLSVEEVDQEINLVEYLRGLHLGSTTYQACKDLFTLRKIGFFPTPVKEDAH